MRDMIEILSKM